MGSLVALADVHADSVSGLPTQRGGNFCRTATAEGEPTENNVLVSHDLVAVAATPEVPALVADFVSWPGKAEELQTVLPEAIRNAFDGSVNFSGCMVLVSEQEARLVTVITLWKGKGRTKHCKENSKRIEQLLMPYVDRWLRTRRLAAFLSTR